MGLKLRLKKNLSGEAGELSEKILIKINIP
jgi:hypothetical protein